MLSEIAIIEIDKLLDLCDTYLLNQHEINVLNSADLDPTTTCDYYDTAQTVMTARSTFDTTQNKSLKMLQSLGEIDGCPITLTTEKVPVVDVPVYGGALE